MKVSHTIESTVLPRSLVPTWSCGSIPSHPARLKFVITAYPPCFLPSQGHLILLADEQLLGSMAFAFVAVKAQLPLGSRLHLFAKLLAAA